MLTGTEEVENLPHVETDFLSGTSPNGMWEATHDSGHPLGLTGSPFHLLEHGMSTLIQVEFLLVSDHLPASVLQVLKSHITVACHHSYMLCLSLSQEYTLRQVCSPASTTDLVNMEASF